MAKLTMLGKGSNNMVWQSPGKLPLRCSSDWSSEVTFGRITRIFQWNVVERLLASLFLDGLQWVILSSMTRYMNKNILRLNVEWLEYITNHKMNSSRSYKNIGFLLVNSRNLVKFTSPSAKAQDQQIAISSNRRKKVEFMPLLFCKMVSFSFLMVPSRWNTE